MTKKKKSFEWASEWKSYHDKATGARGIKAKVKLTPEQERRLAAALLGGISTPKKAKAARKNGRKGGRPRKK